MRQIPGIARPESESEYARECRLWPLARRVERFRFRQAPLLVAALCFAIGEAFSKIPPATPRLTLLLFAGTLALVALTVLALRCALRVTILPIAALWIAAGLWSVEIQPEPKPQTALLAYADGLSRTVQGRIVRIRTLPSRSETAESNLDQDESAWDETAEAEDNANASTSIDLDLTAIEEVTPDISRMVPIVGGARATLFADRDSQPASPHPAQLHCGDSVELPLRLRVPERYRDPGAWQYADYLLDQNIAATASAPAAKLHTLPLTAAVPVWANVQCHIFAAQSWAAARLLAYTRSMPNRRLPTLLRISGEDAGMLNAMLFGDRSRLTQNLRLGFQRTGSFHLFVVSGMHVALLAGLVFWIARRLRLSPLLATALTLTLITAYALLTGFGIPVQRALLMTAVFLAASLLSRERNRLNALGAAALSVLIWSPRALFDASFQMTFLAIVAIAGIATPLGERSFLQYARSSRNLRDRSRDIKLQPRLAQFRIMLRLWSEACEDIFGAPARDLPASLLRKILWAAELALVGIVVEAVMILPMALYFNRATIFALPANAFSIPLVAVLAPLGILTFLGSLISPWIAVLPASALAFLLHAITTLIERIGNSPAADLRIPGPTLAHTLVALACFAFCAWAVRHSRGFAWFAVAILPLGAAIILWPSPPAVHLNQLEVTAIDVGQGDSLLVVSPLGHAMLVDAGGPSGAAANGENAAGSNAFDVGEQVVSPFLWSRQFRRLDVVALTHAHSDHMGGMPAVLRNFRPHELWVAVDPDSQPYRDLLSEAATLGIRVRHLRAGDRIPWDGVNISVLAPTPAYANLGSPINGDSLVMRLQYDRASVLLEGDAEAPSEHLMSSSARAGNGLPIGPDTLLKVGHHGSKTSTTSEFLALAAPEDAVISVGRNNTFGHPRPEIIERLAEAHAHVFRTDQFGLTTFLLSRDGSIATLPPTSVP